MPDDALLDLGWGEPFAAALAVHPGTEPARVVRSDRGGHLAVETASGSERVRLAPQFRRQRDPTALPTVGDWVAVSDQLLDGYRLAEAVLPRRSVIVRKAPDDRAADAQLLAANVDTLMIAVAADQRASGPWLDRYLTLAWQSGTRPVILLTKVDLGGEAEGVQDAADVAGVALYPVSGRTGEGLDALAPLLQPGDTVALLGRSGAGKSTLANRLLGDDRLATRSIREDGRGRHTTTARELVRLPGGATLIDTPGLRELGLWESTQGLSELFSDIEELADGCRFADCAHGDEPGCAIAEALRDGRLSRERLASYRKLTSERQRLEAETAVRQRQAQRREQGRRTRVRREQDRLKGG